MAVMQRCREGGNLVEFRHVSLCRRIRIAIRFYRLPFCCRAVAVAALARPPRLPPRCAPRPSLRVFDPSLIDKTVDPCENFYRYSCNGWFKRNPLPADQAAYGRFTELYELNRLHLRQILEAGGRALRPRARANEQKIGDEYASCMDTATVNKLGLAPLQPELDRIAALQIDGGSAGAAGAPARHRRERLLRHGLEPGLCRFELR